MRIIKVDAEKPQPDMIEVAAKVLEVGGIVVYPTETVYGIGANILEPNAVQRVFEIKERSTDKPSSIAFKDVKSAGRFVYFTPQARKLAEKFLPGPLTIILNTNVDVSELLGKSKIGVRIPSGKVALALLNRVKFPITATSANISGNDSTANAQDAITQIGYRVDVVLDAGPCELAKPSTVVDLSDGKFEIVREGAISRTDIENALK